MPDLYKIIGEYSLKGIHEMAAGFRFNSDLSFEFYYIYGASDRKASGKFKIGNNKIILEGSKAVGKDFGLQQKSRRGKGITVKINHENKFYIQNVVCIFSGKNENYTKETNKEGIAHVIIDECKKIELIHSFFPDVPSLFEINDEESNYFEFCLNPSLEEVVFYNSEIEIVNNDLQCNNLYLFGPKPARFIKI